MTENGNYKLLNQKGELVKDSYPKWRLKFVKPEVIIQEIEDKQENLDDDYHEIEKISDHKKVGRGFKY